MHCHCFTDKQAKSVPYPVSMELWQSLSSMFWRQMEKLFQWTTWDFQSISRAQMKTRVALYYISFSQQMQLLESSEPVRVQAFSMYVTKQVSASKVKHACAKETMPSHFVLQDVLCWISCTRMTVKNIVKNYVLDLAFCYVLCPGTVWGCLSLNRA